jgi:hypothetical protein
MPVTSREIRLKTRPAGMPTPDTFELAETQVPDPGDGQVLIRNAWMSVDPYMRGRMMDRASYVAPFQIGHPLEGGAIGQVIASRNPKFAEGDHVSHMLGWREYALSDGTGVSKVDPDLAPLQAYLGVLGMPGLTAYAGLLDIGEPKEGETVFVSAASGAVGAVVCQIAKAKGCRVIGSVGSQDKADWLVREVGIDGCVNYKATDNLLRSVKDLAPDGIDVYFENVGGPHLEVALELMNPHGRMPFCGMISQYNAERAPEGPKNLIYVVGKRLKLQGFIVSDHFHRLNDFLTDMSGWIKDGKMTWKESVYDGIDKAPEAFMALFTGDNFGKTLVKLSDG